MIQCEVFYHFILQRVTQDSSEIHGSDCILETFTLKEKISNIAGRCKCGAV